MKECRICRVELPISAFNRCAQAKDGLAYECRACRSTEKRAALARRTPEQRERDLAKVRQWQETHPDRVKVYRAARQDAHRAEMRARYWADPRAAIDYAKAGVKANALAKKAALADFKASKGCAHCGQKDPDRLQFHHLDKETKAFTVSQARGWERTWAEVAKCQVLCRTCHAKLHDHLSLQRHKRWLRSPKD